MLIHTQFVEYCEKGDTQKVIDLIYTSGCLFNINDGFVAACEYGHIELVQYLINLHKFMAPYYHKINIKHNNFNHLHKK